MCQKSAKNSCREKFQIEKTKNVMRWIFHVWPYEVGRDSMWCKGVTHLKNSLLKVLNKLRTVMLISGIESYEHFTVYVRCQPDAMLVICQKWKIPIVIVTRYVTCWSHTTCYTCRGGPRTCSHDRAALKHLLDHPLLMTRDPSLPSVIKA